MLYVRSGLRKVSSGNPVFLFAESGHFGGLCLATAILGGHFLTARFPETVPGLLSPRKLAQTCVKDHRAFRFYFCS